MTCADDRHGRPAWQFAMDVQH